MKLAQEYLEIIEKKLRELGENIDELNAKAKSDVKTNYNQKMESLRTQMDEAMSKANDSINTQLKDWSTKIESLTDKAKEEAKKEYKEIVDNIKPKLDEFQVELNRLTKSSNDAWAEVKTGALRAWTEFKGALKSASEKFK